MHDFEKKSLLHLSHITLFLPPPSSALWTSHPGQVQQEQKAPLPLDHKEGLLYRLGRVCHQHFFPSSAPCLLKLYSRKGFLGLPLNQTSFRKWKHSFKYSRMRTKEPRASLPKCTLNEGSPCCGEIPRRGKLQPEPGVLFLKHRYYCEIGGLLPLFPAQV